MENYLRPVTEKVDLKSLLDFLDVSIKYDFNNSTFILYDEQLEKIRADDIKIHDDLADFVLDNVSIFLDDYFLNDCNEELNKLIHGKVLYYYDEIINLTEEFRAEKFKEDWFIYGRNSNNDICGYPPECCYFE